MGGRIAAGRYRDLATRSETSQQVNLIYGRTDLSRDTGADGWRHTGNCSLLVRSVDLYRLTEVGTLNRGERSLAVAMNSSGQIAGSSLSAQGDVPWHAFLWDGIKIKDLGTLGGSESYATAINSFGQVTGYSWKQNNANKHAFLWDGATPEGPWHLGRNPK